MSMKVMSGGGGAPTTFLDQRLAHRKRLLRIFLKKDENTRSRLLAARGAMPGR